MTKISLKSLETLAAMETQAKRAQTEHDLAQQERVEHIENLRALRLAKEAADRDNARIASSAKTATDGKK